MGGDGGGPAGLSCWAAAPTAGARLQRWIGVSPLLALLPARPAQFFFHVCGDGRWFFPPTSTPAQIFPFPLSPTGGKGRGGGGGAGLPLGTAVAQSISPKPRNFLLPKRKKKKKKSQRPPFLPAPLGQSRLALWGFPGGWLRAGTLSGKSGGAPCQALRQAHFGLLPSSSPPSPPSKPPEVAFP